MITERERFTRLARKDSAPRVVSSFNLFQTPPELASRVVRLCGILTGRVLEPSAGLGRLYKAIRNRNADVAVTLVEQSAECCGELYRQMEDDAATTLVQGDFLAMNAERLGLFDRIVMNPPFKMGRDIKHIVHAAGLLKPGGRLVAICAAGPRQRKRFPDLQELSAGSFKGEGTNVNAGIVVLEG